MAGQSERATWPASPRERRPVGGASAACAWPWRSGAARALDPTCVATSGFHAITELRCARLFEFVKLMTGFLSLRSHTTERPLCEVDARMCVTFRFHATHDMSARGALLFTPGE